MQHCASKLVSDVKLERHVRFLSKVAGSGKGNRNRAKFV